MTEQTIEDITELRKKLIVVNRLQALIAEGLLFAVWVDGWEIRIKRTIWSERERIFWNKVEDFLCEVRGLPLPVKKPLSVERNLESKFYKRA